MLVKPTAPVLYRHFFTWFLWKVLLPFLFLFGIWLAYLVKEVPESFATAFAHGEMLLFAAVLLMEMSFEGEELRDPHCRFDLWFDLALPTFKLGALLVILLFGFFRYDVVTLSASVECGVGNDNICHSLSKLVAYAVFNVVVASTTVVIAIFACVKHCEHELMKRLTLLTTI